MIAWSVVKIKMGNSWFRYLYALALSVGVLTFLPKALKRWQKVPPRLAEGKGTAVWIHAVSMGETSAVAPLARLIHERSPGVRLVISSITQTGHEAAKRLMPFALAHVFLPLDFAWVVRRWLDWFSPDLVIVTETDFWFQFLRLAKDRGAKLAVVNGKISERSLMRHQKFPVVSKELLRLFDLICAQNFDFETRFLALGVPQEKLKVTGNLKFDFQTSLLREEEKEDWRSRLGVGKEQQVVVVGSTHDAEESLILNAMRQVWVRHSNVKLVLAPRHPERFGEVARLLEKKGISFDRWSEGCAGAKVLLLDAMGVLRSCYQVADVAVVAGSFTDKVGGHNILEPVEYGVPVVFGPYMFSQPELERLVLEAGAGRQVNSDELDGVLTKLLEDREERIAIGKAGLDLLQRHLGASESTWKELVSLMSDRGDFGLMVHGSSK